MPRGTGAHRPHCTPQRGIAASAPGRSRMALSRRQHPHQCCGCAPRHHHPGVGKAAGTAAVLGDGAARPPGARDTVGAPEDPLHVPSCSFPRGSHPVPGCASSQAGGVGQDGVCGAGATLSPPRRGTETHLPPGGFPTAPWSRHLGLHTSAPQRETGAIITIITATTITIIFSFMLVPN